MDPNSTFLFLLNAIREGAEEAAHDAAAALADWVRVGGFLPKAFETAYAAAKAGDK